MRPPRRPYARYMSSVCRDKMTGEDSSECPGKQDSFTAYAALRLVFAWRQEGVLRRLAAQRILARAIRAWVARRFCAGVVPAACILCRGRNYIAFKGLKPICIACSFSQDIVSRASCGYHAEHHIKALTIIRDALVKLNEIPRPRSRR